MKNKWTFIYSIFFFLLNLCFHTFMPFIEIFCWLLLVFIEWNHICSTVEWRKKNNKNIWERTNWIHFFCFLVLRLMHAINSLKWKILVFTFEHKRQRGIICQRKKKRWKIFVFLFFSISMKWFSFQLKQIAILSFFLLCFEIRHLNVIRSTCQFTFRFIFPFFSVSFDLMFGREQRKAMTFSDVDHDHSFVTLSKTSPSIMHKKQGQYEYFFGFWLIFSTFSLSSTLKPMDRFRVSHFILFIEFCFLFFFRAIFLFHSLSYFFLFCLFRLCLVLNTLCIHNTYPIAT